MGGYIWNRFHWLFSSGGKY